ncbi:MAG TPA: HlyD family secretion protein [Acetobacteraceae bacterium]|nr:HlyD family secretion protein [Acetobacteraceae bacterium]
MSQTAAAPRGAVGEVAGPKRRARTRISRHALGPILMIGGILVVAVGAAEFWLHGGRYVDVDDAYVQAAKEPLSTDVSGIVAEIPVHEGQIVKKGDVLLRLDDRHFRIALEGARAEMNATALRLTAEQRDYKRMLQDIEVKQSQLQSDQANFDRAAALVKSGGVTRAEYDDARFRVAADQHAIASLRTAAEVQLARIGGDADADVRTLPDYLAAKAKVDEAERQLDDTVIRAPFDGMLTQVDTIQPGMYLAASTAAFGIVSTEDVWVEADPKETELTWVKPGDPVEVSVDTYPGRTWKGVVDSIAPNSGSEFSILPAQNTSGNWVKVVQRIPVRIRVEHQEGDPPLRAGMSVETSIDTGHQRHLSDLF